MCIRDRRGTGTDPDDSNPSLPGPGDFPLDPTHPDSPGGSLITPYERYPQLVAAREQAARGTVGRPLTDDETARLNQDGAGPLESIENLIEGVLSTVPGPAEGFLREVLANGVTIATPEVTTDSKNTELPTGTVTAGDLEFLPDLENPVLEELPPQNETCLLYTSDAADE